MVSWTFPRRIVKAPSALCPQHALPSKCPLPPIRDVLRLLSDRYDSLRCNLRPLLDVSSARPWISEKLLRSSVKGILLVTGSRID